MENPITRQEFEAHTKMLQRILEILETGEAMPVFNAADWATAQEAMDILKRSIRTLYRMRDDGKILCKKRGSEPMYYRPDIEKLKCPCMK